MTTHDVDASAEGTAAPLVTVSLVTYQGERWLPGCLASLAAQDLTDYELVIRDNASEDASSSLARAWAAADRRTRVYAAQGNLGYATAHDLTIGGSRGEFVLLLNQDVELDRGFWAAVAAFRAHPEIGAVQGRLRQLDGPGARLDRLDTTGLEMGRDRRAISRHQGQIDGPAHGLAGPVWGADGPAPMYRSAALRDARVPKAGGGWEVLDGSFFLYKEDVDLAWRLRLLGWDTWYEPAALAWHARGTGGTGATSMLDIARTNRTIRYEAKALSWRNQRLMQIKNETIGGYLRDAPWILRRELLSLVFIAVFEPRRLSAIVALLRAAPEAMRKRRYLQSRLHRRSAHVRRSETRRASSWRRRAYDRLPDRLRGPTSAAFGQAAGLRRALRPRSARRSVLPPFQPGASGTILVIDDHIPEFDVHAGALTVWHYLEILCGEGLGVYFRPDDGLRAEPYATALEDLGVQLLLDDVDAHDWIGAYGRDLDWVLLSRPHVARQWLRVVRASSSARVLYLAHDLHYLRERRRHEATGDPHALSESRRLLEIERALFRDVDTVVTFSPDEEPLIRALAPKVDVRVVTPAFYSQRPRPAGIRGGRTPLAQRHDVVFVGAFDHLPNVDAAEVLVNEVMPLVWTSFPDTRVVLIGGHVPEEIESSGVGPGRGHRVRGQPGLLLGTRTPVGGSTAIRQRHQGQDHQQS